MKFLYRLAPYIASFTLLLFVVGTPALAQSQTGALINPLKVSNVKDLLDLLMQAVIDLGTIVLTLMLIYVGFLFVSARGNVEAVGKARQALLWTVIGGLILLGAKAIETVIFATANSLMAP